MPKYRTLKVERATPFVNYQLPGVTKRRDLLPTSPRPPPGSRRPDPDAVRDAFSGACVGSWQGWRIHSPSSEVAANKGGQIAGKITGRRCRWPENPPGRHNSASRGSRARFAAAVMSRPGNRGREKRRNLFKCMSRESCGMQSTCLSCRLRRIYLPPSAPSFLLASPHIPSRPTRSSLRLPSSILACKSHCQDTPLHLADCAPNPCF